MDRLRDVYPYTDACDHSAFWLAISEEVRRTESTWTTESDLARSRAIASSELLPLAVTQKSELRATASAVLTTLLDNEDRVLAPIWLYDHFFHYGLFGKERRESKEWFVSAQYAEALASRATNEWKVAFLSGALMPQLRTLHPIYALSAVGKWDEQCFNKLTLIFLEMTILTP
jgi:hypothetical protein